MKLTASHNLTDAELVKALVGLAATEGIAEPLGHALLKAADCCGPKEPREPAMVELFHRLRAEYNRAVRDLKDALRHPPGLEKALHRTPLTKEQLGRIQQAIRDRFQLIAAQMQEDVAPDAGQIERWQAEGWVAPDVTPESFALTVRPQDRYIHNAFVFGRLQLALEAGTGYNEILRLALTMPLLAPDRYAIAIAETQTANYITALGDDLAKEAGAILARQARDTIRQMAVDFHAQKLQARVLDIEAKQALGFSTESRLVDTWQGFKSELYHAFEDKTRDWDRVAYFELQDAKGQGVAMAIIEESGPKRLVYRMPLPTACPQCKFLFLEEDGTPRLFPAEQLLGNCNNIGRKPYPVKGGVVIEGIRPDGAEGYQPVSGQVHPWCACSPPHPYTGYEPWAMKKRRGEPMAKAVVGQMTRKGADRFHLNLKAALGQSDDKPLAQKTICVDFDGVIADYRLGYQGVDVYGAPLPGAAEAIAQLHADGWKVIIHTTRKETHGLRSYLGRNGIWYDEINCNSDQPPDTNAGKPIADVYLDDRAVRFVSWDQAVADISQLRKSRSRIRLIAPPRVRHLALLRKSHIRAYTRRDGTAVREHDDARNARKLQDLAATARDLEDKEVRVHTIRSVTQEESQRILAATGIAVDGHRFAVSSSGIRHIFRQHGNAGTEAANGQVAVTEADIERIPEIINQPDRVRRGTDTSRGERTIVFEKNYPDGRLHFVAEVLPGVNVLHSKTMFKKKA